MKKNYQHIPVLLKEVLEQFHPKPNQTYVDCTLGGGGHLIPILFSIAPHGKVIGIDVDPKSLEVVQKRIDDKRFIPVLDNYKNIISIVAKNGFKKVDGILIDLGFSSAQVYDEKGIGFNSEMFDMRYNEEIFTNTAYTIINLWAYKKIAQLFREYGEEKLAGPIAKEITIQRKVKKITSAVELTELVAKVYKKFYKKPSFKNPATKVFQALRIEVNEELKNLQSVLPDAVSLLNTSGRLIIISYHSLEDKIVKDFFKQESKDCVCEVEVPQCVCEHKKSIVVITKKPIIPTHEEVEDNPRSRSAKMRVAQKT